jgi:hypothetical protein
MKDDTPNTFEELKRMLDERKRYSDQLVDLDKLIDSTTGHLRKYQEDKASTQSFITRLEEQIRKLGKAV